MNQTWAQSQAKPDDWPKETWHTCCIYVTQTTSMRVRLSESTRVSSHAHYILFPPNELFTCSVFMGFFSPKLKAQGLYTNH